MNRIKQLDTATINKIAAGEVIERPFSIIKELVENAIDAGSGKITVEIKEGGIAFIRVTDNGCGIRADEIETAFSNHATSKINAISDLNSLGTLGFRGEALASIAAVSQLEITSKTADSTYGAYLEIYGGEILTKRDTACNIGTIVVTRNLFYNTPARKKFLKSVAAESGYISDFICKIALSRPDISFRYINNGNEVLYTSGNSDLKTAIYSVYGPEYAEKLLSVNYSDYGITISGYIAKPELLRANRSMEDIFVNGRFVKDKIIGKAAEDAFKTYLTVNRFPAFVLNVETDPRETDVNAHPQKLEIRFSDEEMIYRAVYTAVDNALKSTSLIRGAEWGRAEPSGGGDQTPSTREIHYPDNTLRQSFLAKGRERFVLDEMPTEVSLPAFSTVFYHAPGKPVKAEQETFAPKKLFTNCRIIGQALSTYWIIEENETLYLIDQHAAHERVLFEKARKKLLGGDIVMQVLVVPERLALTEREKGIITENFDYFASLGFEIEALDNELYLQALPMLIAEPENSATLKRLVDMFEDDFAREAASDLYEIKINALALLACKAAVKANDKLSEREAEAFIKELLALDNPFTCPHGRPTIVEMSKYDLELKFKRV